MKNYNGPTPDGLFWIGFSVIVGIVTVLTVRYVALHEPASVQCLKAGGEWVLKYNEGRIYPDEYCAPKVVNRP